MKWLSRTVSALGSNAQVTGDEYRSDAHKFVGRRELNQYEKKRVAKSVTMSSSSAPAQDLEWDSLGIPQVSTAGIFISAVTVLLTSLVWTSEARTPEPWQKFLIAFSGFVFFILWSISSWISGNLYPAKPIKRLLVSVGVPAMILLFVAGAACSAHGPTKPTYSWLGVVAASFGTFVFFVICNGLFRSINRAVRSGFLKGILGFGTLASLFSISVFGLKNQLSTGLGVTGVNIPVPAIMIVFHQIGLVLLLAVLLCSCAVLTWLLIVEAESPTFAVAFALTIGTFSIVGVGAEMGHSVAMIGRSALNDVTTHATVGISHDACIKMGASWEGPYLLFGDGGRGSVVVMRSSLILGNVFPHSRDASVVSDKIDWKPVAPGGICQ